MNPHGRKNVHMALNHARLPVPPPRLLKRQYVRKVYSKQGRFSLQINQNGLRKPADPCLDVILFARLLALTFI